VVFELERQRDDGEESATTEPTLTTGAALTRVDIPTQPNKDVSAAGHEPEPTSVEAPAVSRLIRRQRVFLWLTTSSAVLALGGLVASTMIKSPAQLAADQGVPKASVLTAAVQSEVLKQTVVKRGTVVASGSVAVAPTAEQGAATLVVTALPKKAGDPVRAGEVLAQVSGRPVISLPGAVPAYRDLRPGDSGDDVTELQVGLRSLGYPDSDRRGYFGAGTKDALKGLYQHLGYDPAYTGGPGDAGDQSALAAAANAVTTAGRAVAAAERTLAAAESSGATADVIAQDRQQLQYANEDLQRAKQAQAQLIATTGVELPMGEFVFVSSFPASVATINGSIGSAVAGTLMTLNTGKLVVTTMLQQSDASLLKTGLSVEITSETLGQTATGVISYLGPYTAAQPSTGSGNGAAAAGPGQAGGTTASGYPLTVTPTGGLGTSWLGQNVRLTVTTAATSGPVLVVPSAAVSTDANSTTTVTVLAADGGRRRVPVAPGITTGGYVEVAPVTPGALQAGDKVVTG
jgi:hypothetical protein